MAKWLPESRRAFGQGITHSFSRLGNAIAPIFIARDHRWKGWRESFWLVGIVSMVWVFFWIWYFRDHPQTTRR